MIQDEKSLHASQGDISRTWKVCSHFSRVNALYRHHHIDHHLSPQTPLGDGDWSLEKKMADATGYYQKSKNTTRPHTIGASAHTEYTYTCTCRAPFKIIRLQMPSRRGHQRVYSTKWGQLCLLSQDPRTQHSELAGNNAFTLETEDSSRCFHKTA